MNDANQKGSAIVIALFVLALVSVFVALAMSRSAADAAAVGNETSEARTFYAAQGSLESMTRNFDKIYDVRLNPTASDITNVQNATVPGLSAPAGSFTFNQSVLQTSTRVPVVLSGGPFSGLYAIRDTWRLQTTATDTYGIVTASTTNNSGTQVQLARNILNNLIPIFQFGIFYDDDLEFHPGPRFDFGGRVHSNGSIFLMAGTGLYFSSKVTAAKHVFTDVAKNGTASTNWGDNVFVKNASSTYVQLHSYMGSVLTSPVNGAPASTTPLPTTYTSANWTTNKALFDGNLVAYAPLLQLPLKLNSDLTSQNLDLVEIVKRGKSVGDLYNNKTGTVAAPNIVAVTAAGADDAITAGERYYNKTGIRVSLADSKAKLPGCSTATATAVATACGVRLDGDTGGLTAGGSNHQGYVPKPMVGSPAYQATGINGDRFYTGTPAGREVWIKIETIQYNTVTTNFDANDITQDILSLGVTDGPPPTSILPSSVFSWNDPSYVGNDARSIIKLQRFLMPGGALTDSGAHISNFTDLGNSNTYNYVLARTIVSGNCLTGTGGSLVDSGSYTNGGYTFTGDNRAGLRMATINGVVRQCMAAFPINMFDTREGLYNDSTSVFDPAAAYGSNVPWAGVMSMVDIDVANLRTFLNGTYNANMPSGTPYATANGHVLRSTDIPGNAGWVFYVSDRRGDFDFDGEYDMEDIFGQNDGILQTGEDVNQNGTLEAEYNNEAVRYTGAGNHVSPDIAAVFEHKYYRRGVRLINGAIPPGIYDSVTPANTKGFTLASENGVYVKGDYNATGVASYGTPTPSTDYLPQNTANHIPCSVASDALTVLSNNWTDGNSFTSPFNLGNRTTTETTQRFGLISGDAITTLNATPNQGGGDLRLNGGVHNFLRFLENWGNNLNYDGSLINLYNSHNNNGAFKCCNQVYSPPTRNWVFDATFLDVNRLPPGTPYFQYAQTTGFERTNF